MAPKKVKVTVTGAAGQIGYALLFRIASGQMFGPDTKVELRLLELPAALSALEGVAMELEDCAFPLLDGIVCTSELKTAFDGSNWALLVGAVPRKAGMERADLLKVNGGIFVPQGKAINEVAADNVRVLTVGNPCNTNALIAKYAAPDVPDDRFYAMTTLDENRAKALLAQKSNRPITSISEMTIWGNHSATQWPDFFNAKIDGKPAPEIIGDEDWLMNTFVEQVQKRGAAIIKARGASSAASAANAIVNTVCNLIHETPAGTSFSTALSSNGEYGVQKGLIFSYPCRRQDGRVRVIENVIQTPYGQKKFDITHRELMEEFEAVKQMNLISP